MSDIEGKDVPDSIQIFRLEVVNRVSTGYEPHAAFRSSSKKTDGTRRPPLALHTVGRKFRTCIRQQQFPYRVHRADRSACTRALPNRAGC